MLAAFGATQQRRIINTGTHGSSDRSHRPLHGDEERGTGVLHQVPSIRHLDGFRATLGGSLDVARATIAGERWTYIEAAGVSPRQDKVRARPDGVTLSR